MQTLLLITTVLSLGVAAVMSAIVWRNARQERRRSSARVAVLESELYGIDQSAPVIGETRQRPAQAFVVIAAGLCVFGVVAILAGVISGSGVAEGRRSDGPERAAVPPQAAPPLELMALTHEREADWLTVRGIVRNPATAASLADVTAVVLVFDQSGLFVASSRGALVASPLPSGSESSFVVVVPYTGSIGRYRVSFRVGSGVLPHVDRRG